MKLAFLLLPGILLAQSDWSVPTEFSTAGYAREQRAKGVALIGPGPAGAMTQVFDATPYRGTAVRLRAAVQAEGAATAQLLLRVDRAPGKLGFIDNMGDRPIAAGPWKTYELTGEVAADAVSIEVGVLSSGAGAVGIDAISFEKLPPASADSAAERAAIERLYTRIDSAYGEGDLDAIASLATADAQITLPSGRTPLAAVLKQIMEQVHKGAKFRSASTVTAFQMSGAEATAWVNNDSSADAAGVLSSNRDRWVKTASGWKLRESALIATRPLTPPEVLSEIAARAAMPALPDVRIVLFSGERPPEIPGFTVVDARIDSRAGAQAAIAYLREHVPDEAGPAALTLQGTDVGRLAALIRVFDSHRAATPEWLFARQGAVIAYQSVALAERPDEVTAGQVIWFASQAYPREKLLVVVRDALKAAPLVRNRYGKQVYVLGALPREILGGELFLDLGGIPPASALGRWVAGQKIPYDGVVGR